MYIYCGSTVSTIVVLCLCDDGCLYCCSTVSILAVLCLRDEVCLYYGSTVSTKVRCSYTVVVLLVI